jgi:hypothetical protein
VARSFTFSTALWERPMIRRDRRLEGLASEGRLTAQSSSPPARIRSLAAAHRERYADAGLSAR